MMMLLMVRLLLVLLLLWLGVRWFEQRTVYVPSRVLEVTPAEAGLVFEDVFFMTEDAVRLHGWWIPHPRARGTVLYCHGNGANMANRVGLCANLHQLAVNIFIFDYRGYGQSKGWPTEAGTYRDVRAAFEVVRARYDDAEQPPVVAYGGSLGGPIAAQLALDKPLKGLILEASFPSTPELGRILYPWLPVRWFARYRYDASAKVSTVSVPKLFASSRDDQLVPFELGQSLYEAAAEPKQFVELRGPHDEGGWQSDPAYRHALEQFLHRTLGPVGGAGLPSPP
jgi:fermentation-respiration switch protein FrsA (DUF1100 family)